MRLAIAMTLAALLSAPALADGPWWDSAWQARRKVTVTVPAQPLPGDDACIVTFYTAGLAKSDGSDIRVVYRGKPTEHKLYGLGPGDTATIAFKANRNLRECEIYFGNPKAADPGYDWEPQRGLILETRGFPGGSPRTLQSVRDMLRKSQPFHGAGPVDRVWQGHNLFGPTDGFVSHYIGWLICPVPGTYSFATSSDDASFVLVNGKVATKWPGWHGPVADARYSGTLTLPTGIHRFEYLHVNTGASSCAVAAWKPPGASAFEVIPANYFAPLSRASVAPLELRGEPYAADFQCEIVGEALLSGTDARYAVKVAFVNASSGGSTGIVAWDFGDGQKARGPQATHIYLAEGIYPVTMTIGVGGAARSVTNRICVHQHWGWQTRKEIDDIGSYLPEIARYDLDTLDALSAGVLMSLAIERNDTAFVRRAALAGIRGAQRADAARFEETTRTLRAVLGAGQMAADDAVLAVYSDVFKSLSGDLKAAAAAALSDMLLERGMPREAAAFAKAALGEKLGDRAKRRLLVAYGDAARYSSDADAARYAYVAADEVAVEQSAVQRAALGGGRALEVEDYLRREQYEDAESALDRWDLERPREKLVGYSSYLRARVYDAQGRADRALSELNAIAVVSPASAYAPKALLLSAEISRRGGNRDAARAALSRIISDYETSPEAVEARDRMRALGTF